MKFPPRNTTQQGYVSDLTLLDREALSKRKSFRHDTVPEDGHSCSSAKPIRLSALASLFALAATLFLTSCDREKKADIATREKILLLGNGAEPKALDPHLISSLGDSNILRSLFEGLVTYNAESDTIHDPGVAERWEANEDFTEWRFFLRKNAKWSNGDPVTAHDFVYAYNRLLHPEMGGPYASMLFFLKNGEAYNKGEIKEFSEVGVEAVNDYELLCTLENPAPYFPGVVKHGTWYPVHRPTIEKYGSMTDHFTAWQKPGNHVGNGPFQLTEWRINAGVKVRRNPHYWDAKTVKLNGINFYPIDNIYTDEKAFRNRLTHYVYEVPANLIPLYEEKNDPALRTEIWAGSYFYRCNVNRPPMDNVDFRRALAYSIDRETIVKYVKMGGEIPAYGFTPPTEGGYAPPKVIHFNPEKAKEYLKKAGYEDGSEVPEFTIIMNTHESHKSIAVAIQDMWKKTLNLQNVKIENQEWKVYQKTVQDENYDVARSGWIGDYVDPSTFLDLLTSENTNNNTGWKNSEYDRILTESTRIRDPQERYAKMQEAEAILLDEVPILPIYWYTRVYLISPDVKNWNPLLLDMRPYKHIDLEPSEGGKSP